MILALEIVGLITMIVIILLSIWAFVIANQAYCQTKYQNYLLEKLIQSINMFCMNNNLNKHNTEDFKEDINDN